MKLKRGEGLNVVPFIDVMLVLLAIVLSISTFIAQGKIPINLPQVDNIDRKLDDKPMVILISSDNRIYIDDKEVLDVEIKHAIAKLNDKDPIEIRSDKDAKFESFVRIISIIKDKGHENFSISAQSE